MRHEPETQAVIDPGIASAVIAWIGDVAGGTVTRAERFVHTRPMWTVDVRRPDGSDVELFARGDRGPASALNAFYDLAREAVVVDALTARRSADSTIHRLRARR